MIELPEAQTLAKQTNEFLIGKKISQVIVGQSPHKFAWYNGDPSSYQSLLSERKIDGGVAVGGMIEIQAEGAILLFGDGVTLTYTGSESKPPEKHQLHITFQDGTSLSASVQMYGGLWCFEAGNFDNPYYLQGKTKPSPLTEAFSEAYFMDALMGENNQKLSLKALLATEQRIPGLGNGVLQDILYNGGLHPKKKVKDLTNNEIEKLRNTIKTTLAEMTSLGGRDTEKDLLGNFGGYQTKVSKKTLGKPCPICGSIINKEAYMGGSIYYCQGCQTL